MSKKSHAPRKSPTHFKQVPLKVVKRLVGGANPTTKKSRPDNLIVETGRTKTECYSMPTP
jgi:hypothetical protein